MAFRLWALDAKGGQACVVEDGDRWFLISAERDWEPTPLRGQADAVRWAMSLSVSLRDQEYNSLGDLVQATQDEHVQMRTSAPPHVADAVKCWPTQLFDSTDLWLPHDRESELFWAYWTELVVRLSPPWADAVPNWLAVESHLGGLRQNNPAWKRHAAYLTHLALHFLWGKVDAIEYGVSLPLTEDWWASGDQGLYASWLALSMFRMVAKWLGVGIENSRTSRDLTEDWLRFRSIIQETATAVAQRDISALSPRMRLVELEYALVRDEIVFDWVDISATYAQLIAMDSRDWNSALMQDRERCVQRLSALYLAVDKLEGQERDVAIALLSSGRGKALRMFGSSHIRRVIEQVAPTADFGRPMTIGWNRSYRSESLDVSDEGKRSVASATTQQTNVMWGISQIDPLNPSARKRLNGRVPAGGYEIPEEALVLAIRTWEQKGEYERVRALLEVLVDRCLPEFQRGAWTLRHRPNLMEAAIAGMIEQLVREVQDPHETFMTLNFFFYLRTLCADNVMRVLRQEERLRYRRDEQTEHQAALESDAQYMLDYLRDPLDRQIVRLRAFEHLRWDDIAKICGTTERTARARYEEAIVRLRHTNEIKSTIEQLSIG